MKICKKCGYTYAENFKHCPQCGKKQDGSKQDEIKKAIVITVCSVAAVCIMGVILVISLGISEEKRSEDMAASVMQTAHADPTSAPVITAAPAAEVPVQESERMYIVNVKNSVYLRTQPGSEDYYCTIPLGEAVDAAMEQMGSDGVRYRMVSYNGQTGWVKSEYLSETWHEPKAYISEADATAIAREYMKGYNNVPDNARVVVTDNGESYSVLFEYYIGGEKEEIGCAVDKKTGEVLYVAG